MNKVHPFFLLLFIFIIHCYKDYYKILNVSRNADLKTIKSSYRTLAMKYHPDRNKDDSDAKEKFTDVSNGHLK